MAEYEGFTPDVEDEIRSLARSFTQNSTTEADRLSLVRTISHMSQVPGSVPMDDVDQRLDPNSERFDLRFWVKNLRKLVTLEPDYYKPAQLGVAFKELRAYGLSSDFDFQTTFGNVIFKRLRLLLLTHQPSYIKNHKFDILKPMEGLCLPGEVTVILGRPGAGCSTFLKTIAAQTNGFNVDENSFLSYDGFSQKEISQNYRGEVVYCAETESHFPYLTVSETLDFAARLRTPKNRPKGISREVYARHISDVAMATYGLLAARNTKVGNDFVRGVSGGERKRVSIAEVYLSQASLQCWDNSTRGLDSATALEFIRALKTSASITKVTPLVAIYQCSQDAYDMFDNVILLYEGYQIYSGSATDAKRYFVDMGWECPARQTTADFLTSLTNPEQRNPQKGYENKVPRTPEEFYSRWRNSEERQALLKRIDAYISSSEVKLSKARFEDHHHAAQTSHTKSSEPYTVSFPMQVRYLMWRNILRTKGNPSVSLFMIGGNICVSILITTQFQLLHFNTGSFYYRTAVLFFAVLFNGFCSLLEVFPLFEARPIVEKHRAYGLYRPAADAVASLITELPVKILTSLGFNLILYFGVNLRRHAGRFFFFLLMNFFITLTMSNLFRGIASCFKALEEAMAPASIFLFALIIFTGFVIPPRSMPGWCRWMNYLDPIAYAFESLIVNEFHGLHFPCSRMVPSGGAYPTSGNSTICATVGALPGETYLSGDRYVQLSFEYYNSHKWRNFGILIAFLIAFLIGYLLIAEFNRAEDKGGEILVFQRAALKKSRNLQKDLENGSGAGLKPEETVEDSTSSRHGDDGLQLALSKQIFHWRQLRYQVKIKSENRVILNNIDGWVKPGQITALMGASGAGKTTLLNALSDRLTSGEITDGTRMVNGNSLDASFQRSIGYVQQQDLHLETSTVREALRFSAYLRQPSFVSKKEKDEYVEQIIQLLDMEKYAAAVVGVPGEGLNVEQRKRLTIGVELVAKPELLLFLDEPTSGLDSETAWSICKLIRKLADHGVPILCTIHQPSAILMQDFDRLLFLQKGGQIVYFGDLGESCKTMIEYFEKYGAPRCPPTANPAEWMLEVIGAAPGSIAEQDYHQVWLNSTEYQDVQHELDNMETELIKIPKSDDPELLKSYAAPFWVQYKLVTKRVLEQYWRTPSYTMSKVLLGVVGSIFNGFAFFNEDNSLQGLQNQMFSVFMFLVVFVTLSHQYLPHFVAQRSLYEVRELPSKTFSWLTFIAAQITGEIPWNICLGTVSYFVWYYPIGMYHNAQDTNTVASRGATMWFTIVIFFVYSSTLSQLCISFLELAENAANLAILLFAICLNFCGVLVPYAKIPRFWKFMYRVNPFTYLVSVMLSTGLANSDVVCSERELLQFLPVGNYTCGEYMAPYMSVAGGYLVDNSTTGICKYCTAASTNVFLKSIGASFIHRWRDIGIFISFGAFNIIATIFLYWLTRVPKGSRHKLGSGKLKAKIEKVKVHLGK
ncbi:CIC11C00000003493 [Sungouiella intermedia]|uniref:CIC11C00000003493 n=1 Tax=Sungouiella intermedia TaxID=45354 RepID=A0A1L0BC98_9ASCO|nr:CIC11C00000003493 [[Candida] intermedia]